MENRFSALYDLGQRLVLLRDPQQIAEAVLEIAAQVLNLQDSDFLLVDESHKELYVIARQGELSCAEGLRLPLNGERGITVAAACAGQPVYVIDVRQDPRYVDIGFSAVSEFAVPVQIEGRVLGVLNVESTEFDAFSEADRELLCILANQAALALENARLHTHELRTIEELAILNELNRRISASLDFQETLDAVVASASELIPCALAEVSLWDAQTGMLTLQAIRSEPDRVYPVGRSFPPGEGYTGWIVREKKPLLVPDVDSFQEIRPHLLPDERPFNAYAGVPLLAGDTLVGTLVLVSNEAGAFNADDIRLLQSMAHQAAVAIHNAQLFKATTRREAELAALNNIAEAVSLSLDLETLLDQTLDQVIEITSADGGAIRLIDAKTNEAVLYAHRGLSEAHVTEASRLPLSEDDPNLSVGVGWVVRTGQVSISEDLWTDARLPVELQEHMVEEGYRSLAEIPLRAQDRVVGTLGVVKNAPSWFGEEDINLLNAIGQQVGIAIANAQLFRETQRKARQLAALNAVASVINRPLLLQEILDLAIEKVIEVMETDAGGIRLLNPDTEELSIVSSKGLTPDYIRRVDCIHLGEGVVGRVAQTGEPIVVRDLTDPSHMVSQAASDEGFHTFAVVPLRTKEEIVGTLGVVTRYIRDFSTEEMDLLTAIGHQIGIAVENARLYEDLARRAKEMEAIQEEALKAERLAAVGRVAASVAHDLRSPLGGIMRSAEFLARPELTPSTREKLSQAILSLTQRLNNTSQQILEYVQKERLLLRRAPCRLSKFLEDVLTVLEVDFSDQGIEVVRDFRYRGELIMDSDRIAQVVYNIAVNARDAMHKGGKFTVSTRKVKDQVEMRFLDTGPGVPVQVGERIFEPFFSYGKRQGAGLGLAIARRIVEEHGGIIRLESREGKGAEFVVTLPLC